MNMSTNDRTVLMLRHFSECSYEEIAEILDLDEKTVKSRLVRGAAPPARNAEGFSAG